MNDKKEIALEERAREEDRLFSPSAARNRDVIRDAFQSAMPASGVILEIGSGTGEHAVHICTQNRDFDWRPSDPDAASRRSIAAWTAHLGLSNISPPLDLDVTNEGWTDALAAPIDGVASINMIHIAPFDAAQGLISGAGALLRTGGKLFLYGPFSRNGVHTAASNADFDASLKSRDPRWGVRDIENDLMPLAATASLSLARVIEMPANNLSLIWEKS